MVIFFGKSSLFPREIIKNQFPQIRDRELVKSYQIYTARAISYLHTSSWFTHKRQFHVRCFIQASQVAMVIREKNLTHDIETELENKLQLISVTNCRLRRNQEPLCNCHHYII